VKAHEIMGKFLDIAKNAGETVYFVRTDSFTVRKSALPLFEKYMGTELGMLKVEKSTTTGIKVYNKNKIKFY
jgi:hypothetical protein